MTCVRCEVCHKEVPLSEAVVPEATDYFIYFLRLSFFDSHGPSRFATAQEWGVTARN